MVSGRRQLNGDQKQKRLFWERNQSGRFKCESGSILHLMSGNFRFRSKVQQEKIENLVNGITVAIQSTNVDEDNGLLIIYLQSESARTNLHVILNCHGLVDTRPAIMVLKPEMANHTELQ